ncbi:MAG: cell division protein FtsA [Prolixibacteraceae bacterium]
MNERNIVAAIDIGTNTVICLIGQESKDNKIQILGNSIVASAGVRRGMIFNIEETVQSIKRAVEKATFKLDVDITKLYVNVAGQQIHTIERQLSTEIGLGKIITKLDIKNLYEEAKNIDLSDGEKVYHVINQSYSVDGEAGIRNPIGIAGEELVAEYRLIIGPANYEEKLWACLKKAGFEMVKCVVNPVAASEAVLSEDEKEAGVVVVDLGGGTTSISIFYDSVLRYLSIIPFGGNVVTNDIKEGYTLLLRQAESLKVQYGSAMGEHAPENKVVTIPAINGWEAKEISFKSLAYIIQARMEEIVESVYYQIEKSGYADHLGAGIVVTGGGAKLDGLRQLILFKTGMDVRIGKAINGLPSKEEKVIDTPQYATAFGLIKMAMRNVDAQNDGMINSKRKKKERSGNKYGESIIQRLSLFFNEEDAEF